jgi:hypothetical protein
MAENREQFLKYLLGLGVEEDDAKKAADRYNSAIKEIQNRVSSSSSSTSSSSSGVAGAISEGFIDQQVNNIARISTATAGKIVDGIKGMATLNPIELIGGILNASTASAGAIIGDLAKLDKELIERVRGTSGYVGQVATFMQESIREAMISAQDFGVSTNESIEAVTSLMENGERMAVYSEDTISAGLQASLAFTTSSKKILENAENFRNVGIGLDSASKSITDIGSKSIAMGLSAKATSETLITNIGKLNQYGFQNGIKGLGKMVQEAQSLKINIDDTFRVAEKLYDPEGAISLSANLQVIGGAFGDLGDPIKLMYDATNNVESLQTSIIGAARSLATYNAEQGRFEVTGANLRRAKAMSDALGISMAEMTNMAVKGAAKFEAMSQLDIFPDVTPEQKEFVSNLATMKDGKVGFDLPKNMIDSLGLKNIQDGFVGLDQLSGDQVSELQKLQVKMDNEKPIDIARGQFNETTRILNVATAIYLRLMDDSRKTGVGSAAASGMEKAAKFMEQINPGQNNTGQIASRTADLAADAAGKTKEYMSEQLNNVLSPEVKDLIISLKNSLIEKVKTLELPSMDNIKETGTEIKEKIQEVLEPIFKNFTGAVNLKVDVNGNNPLLANMVIDEILKNPQIRADFMNSITKSEKTYT